MGSADADVRASCPNVNRNIRRIWYRYSVGGELAIVETVATIEQNKRWNNKGGSQKSPKQSIDSS